MRLVAAVSLFFFLLAPALLKLGILVWYEANQSYVAHTLCENRNRPERHCNGKCYLYKQLAKADGNTHPERPLPVEISKWELPPFLMPAPLLFVPAPLEETTQGFAEHTPYIGHFVADIFHPPA